jgi:hypothetical protein
LNASPTPISSSFFARFAINENGFDVTPAFIVKGGLQYGNAVLVERRKASRHDGRQIGVFALERGIDGILKGWPHFGLCRRKGAV